MSYDMIDLKIQLFFGIVFAILVVIAIAIAIVMAIEEYDPNYKFEDNRSMFELSFKELFQRAWNKTKNVK